MNALRRLAVAACALGALAFARAQGVFTPGPLTVSLGMDVLTQSERARAGHHGSGAGHRRPKRANPAVLLYRSDPARGRRDLEGFVAKLRTTDPKGAEGLRKSGPSLLAQTRAAARKVGLNPNSVGDAMAIYAVTAWYAVRGSTDSKPADFRAASRQFARAASVPAIGRASDALKQQTAESMLLFAALNEGWVTNAKKAPAAMAKVRAAVAQGARTTFGFDLAKLRLGANGFY